MEEITFEIIERFGTYGEYNNGWNGEVNLISWNENDPKIDIRRWNENGKCSKGITLSVEEARMLGEILIRI